MCRAGIREYARQHGATFGALEEAEVEAWLGQQQAQSLGRPEAAAAGRGIATVASAGAGLGGAGGGVGSGSGDEQQQQGPAYSLFAYPSMDNYAGVLYPLSWVERVQARSNATHVWKVRDSGSACMAAAQQLLKCEGIAKAACAPGVHFAAAARTQVGLA